MVVKFADTQN